MEEKRDKDMAMPKNQSKTITVSDKKVMKTAKGIMDKYNKTFEKLAKN